MSIGVRLGLRVRTGRGLRSGKAALGGFGFGGLTWVLLGTVGAWNVAPSLPLVAAAAAPGGWPGGAPWVRAGPVPRASGVP